MKKTIILTFALLFLCGIVVSATFVTAGADSVRITTNKVDKKSNSLVKTYRYTVDFTENGNLVGDGTYMSPYPIQSPRDLPINDRVYLTKLHIYGIVVSHCEDCNISVLTANVSKCKDENNVAVLDNPPKILTTKKLTCVE